jgi:hypothetical protein
MKPSHGPVVIKRAVLGRWPDGPMCRAGSSDKLFSINFVFSIKILFDIIKFEPKIYDSTLNNIIKIVWPTPSHAQASPPARYRVVLVPSQFLPTDPFSRVGWSRIAVRRGRLARGTRDWTGSDHVAMYCCYLSHSRSPRKYYLQESVARLEKD